MTAKDDILAAIRAAAVHNNGRAPGAKVFHAQSGVSRSDLWNAGFARYSDAVTAAGISPNTLVSAIDTDTMMRELGRLVRDLGRFPSISDLKAARRSRLELPSYEAYFRLSGRSWRDCLVGYWSFVGVDPNMTILSGC